MMIREDEDREIEVSASRRGHLEFSIEIPGSQDCMYFNLNKEEALALKEFLTGWLSGKTEYEVP